MSRYDVTPDEEPLDLAAVAADDQLVEQLRHSLSPDAAVIWDDDDDEVDPAFALLRSLQRDVSGDLPAESADTPPGIIELLPRRRRLSRSATIAAVAAGVLSIGGVAAASAPGQPLAGMRSAVANAVSDAVDAITPDAPVGPALVDPTRTSTPSPKATPPGDAVSAAARSAAAVLQIEANLDRAVSFLDDGKYEPAQAQLDAAARKLDYVIVPADHNRLAARLAQLQARLAAMPDPRESDGRADDKGKPTTPGATHSPKPLPTRSSRGVDNGDGPVSTNVHVPGAEHGAGQSGSGE